MFLNLYAVANQVEGEEQVPVSFQAVGDLVIKNEMTKKDLKVIVLRILSSMVLGTRTVRNVEAEAKRWKSIPFELAR